MIQLFQKVRITTSIHCSCLLKDKIIILIEVDHPIVFQQHDLCQLAKEKRMGELRLDALKKACQELEAKVTGSKRKMETFVSALQNYIFTQSSKGCKYCRSIGY